jgi:hypothetical protein
VNSDGTITVTDWKDYPEGVPKPESPLRLVEGEEYAAARRAANAENRRIHRNDPTLKDFEFHEIQPVKFGGSPTDPLNKIPLKSPQHDKVTSWWKAFQTAIEKAT